MIESDSVVQLVKFNLNLLQLLKELLQLYLREMYLLALIDVGRRELFELSSLYIFTIFPCLLIGLEVECEVEFWCSYISCEYCLLTS